MKNYSRKHMKQLKNKIAYNVLYDSNYNMFASLSERDIKVCRDYIMQSARNHAKKEIRSDIL